MGKKYVIKNINARIRKSSFLIKKLGRSGPIVRGSIVKIARVCGNKNCKCARGSKHVSDYLTFRDKDTGKTKTIYIPAALINEVRGWVNSYGELQRIMEEICKEQRSIIRQYVTERKRPKK